jgi:Rrf2 family protein
MSASNKLSTAVKAICYLAASLPEAKTSFEISENTGINASKLRKILSMLVKSNIVESTYGLNGGFLLKKDPTSIHLQEIYCAIEDRKAFHMDVAKAGNNPTENTELLNEFFLNLFADIQVDIENKMRTINIKQIIQTLK